MTDDIGEDYCVVGAFRQLRKPVSLLDVRLDEYVLRVWGLRLGNHFCADVDTDAKRRLEARQHVPVATPDLENTRAFGYELRQILIVALVEISVARNPGCAIGR